jgi:hypothetical protein
MWATCTAALVSRVPYEEGAKLPASPFCFLGALPGRHGRLSVILSAGRVRHPQDERTPRPERAGGPAFASGKERTPWHGHPSVNPSSVVLPCLSVDAVCLSPPHAPNLVLIASRASSCHLATARPQRPPTPRMVVWLGSAQVHRFLLAMTPPCLAVATQANRTHSVGVELWLTVRKAVEPIDWFPVAVV